MSKNKAYYSENREVILEQKKQHYSENRDSILAYKKKSYNSEKKRAYNQAYYDKKKELVKELAKTYRKNNKSKVNSINANNRAKKKKASPTWLTKQHKYEMQQIYLNCPEGMQVDHIIPLSNDIVCGLHVPWNLQYLTIEENLKKYNKIQEIYAKT